MIGYGLWDLFMNRFSIIFYKETNLVRFLSVFVQSNPNTEIWYIKRYLHGNKMSECDRCNDLIPFSKKTST